MYLIKNILKLPKKMILIFLSNMLNFENMVRCFNPFIYWSLGLSKRVEKVLKHGILNGIENSRNNESTLVLYTLRAPHLVH